MSGAAIGAVWHATCVMPTPSSERMYLIQRQLQRRRGCMYLNPKDLSSAILESTGYGHLSVRRLAYKLRSPRKPVLSLVEAQVISGKVERKYIFLACKQIRAAG